MSDIASRAEEAADIALGAAGVAVKAGNKAVAAVPIPDPRDDVNFQRLAGLEQSTLARLMPRRRNHWPKLLEHEQRLAELDGRQEVLRAELSELRQQRETAPERHALAVAGWLERGEPGERPGSDADVLEQAIVTKEAELVAVDHLVAKLLAAKIDYVTKNRASLRRTAEGATAKARASYEQAIVALAGAREELLTCRSDQMWAELYPSETTRQSRGTEVNLSLGLQAPVKRTLGITTQLPITAIHEALKADAATIAERLTPEQREELGVGPQATPEQVAMWDSDPRHQEWAAAKRRELNELAQWAMTPAQLRNMAQEMDE
ncbi:MAG: hypothetical protein H0T97_12795 [Actinobacteria bacterium]|nr:hypothetical protein [Actinomycetota bacterium]